MRFRITVEFEVEVVGDDLEREEQYTRAREALLDGIQEIVEDLAYDDPDLPIIVGNVDLLLPDRRALDNEVKTIEEIDHILKPGDRVRIVVGSYKGQVGQVVHPPLEKTYDDGRVFVRLSEVSCAMAYRSYEVEWIGP